MGFYYENRLAMNLKFFFLFLAKPRLLMFSAISGCLIASALVAVKWVFYHWATSLDLNVFDRKKKINLRKLNLNLNVRIIRKVCFLEACVIWIFSGFLNFFQLRESTWRNGRAWGSIGSDHLDSRTRLP